MSDAARIRTVWWTLHRWIGVGLAVLLVPIAVSGALLVWHDHLDAVIHPGRYAVSGAQMIQPSVYLASAGTALAGSAQPAAIRFPESEGWPVVVMARGAARAESGPPRIINVYLDPPTARVLDVVDFRPSLIGWLHRFHENLTIPEYSGRAIVGWVGVGMLILSLTGIWLWWPRNGAFLPGLRWRRATHTTTNLHHLLGFWISIPLAVVSFTGIYLGFPQTARQVMSSIAPMTPQGPRPGFGATVRDTGLVRMAHCLRRWRRNRARAPRSYSCQPPMRTLASALARGAAKPQASETAATQPRPVPVPAGAFNCARRTAARSPPSWSTTAAVRSSARPIRWRETARRNGYAGSTKAVTADRSGNSLCS
jgi:uncharacterized iron-regulated membrane protein